MNFLVTTIAMTFSADEYAAVTGHAAKLGVPLDTYVQPLLHEIAARRGKSVEEFLKPGILIAADDTGSESEAEWRTSRRGGAW
ncbi:hypothetical protein [Streptomyces sp. NPDC017529]|uniref:hypothetical protein n=1 Tax=Streptomyces sp. NPDC017529 TaxID=3365000 RepID=UPI0037B2F082